MNKYAYFLVLLMQRRGGFSLYLKNKSFKRKKRHRKDRLKDIETFSTSLGAVVSVSFEKYYLFCFNCLEYKNVCFLRENKPIYFLLYIQNY